MRRARGTGGISYDKVNRVWIGSVSQTVDGKRVRCAVTAPTRNEAEAKLDLLRREISTEDEIDPRLEAGWMMPPGLRYQSQHRIVAQIRGLPQWCAKCGTTDPDAQYQWAFNNVGDRRKPADYIRLCRKCHAKADRRLKARERKPLTEDVVRECRKRYAAGGETYASLAEEFGRGRAAIGNAITRKTFKHIA